MTTSEPETEPGLIRNIAEVLAGLQVIRSIEGGRIMGAALAPYDRLRKQLDLFGWPRPADHERALRKHLTELADGEADRRQRFVTEEGVNACAACHMPMVDGVIAHKLDCTAMWSSPGPRP
jgi:hypothetical protein